MFPKQFTFGDNDDEFFGDIEASRKNLSNIFGISLETAQHNSQNQNNIDAETRKNNSIQKKTVNEKTINKQETISTWNIEAAKVVTAFKLVNEEYIPQGKVGLAILKNSENSQKIILYRSKKNVISNLTIVKDMKIYVKGSYLQYHDDLNILWSLLFQGDEISEIVQHITVNIPLDKRPDIDQTSDENMSSVETENTVDITESVGKTSRRSSNVSTTKGDGKIRENKAEILSRMAKMGQALPMVPPTTTTDFTCSSDEETIGDTKTVKRRTPPKPIPRKLKSTQSSSISTSPHQHRPQQQNQLVPLSSESSSVQSNTLSRSSTVCPNDPQLLNVLLAENRTQNAEVRLNISKLETKVEKILDKIDLIGIRSSVDSGKAKEDELIQLEEKILALKKENRNLKTKINELENEAKTLNDLTSVVTKLSDSETIRSLEKNETITKIDISEFNNLVEQFQLNQEENSEMSEVEILKELVRKCSIRMEALEAAVIEKEKDTEAKFNQLIEEKNEIIKETEKLNFLKEENSKLEEKSNYLLHELEIMQQEKTKMKEQFEKCEEESEKTVENLVKGIMNNLYQMLVTKIDEDKYYSSTEILKICGNAIRLETNNAIKNKKEKDKKNEKSK